jgi:hypothetical protein
MMRRASEAAVNQGGNGSDFGRALDLSERWCERDPVIRAHMSRFDADDLTRSGRRHDRHLAAELIRLVRLTLFKYLQQNKTARQHTNLYYSIAYANSHN